VGQLGNGKSHFGMRLLHQWGRQIALNLLLITAVVTAAVFLRSRATEWLPPMLSGENRAKAILWLGAMIVSLPMLIAVFRKLQAAGLLVSEMSVSHAAGGENTAALRAIVASIVVIAGSAGLVLFIMLLSSAILPSRNVLVVLALVLIAATILLWRSFIRIYSKAQFALRETFDQPIERSHAESVALPPVLIGAELRHVEIEPNFVAAGRLIGELQLRTATGASIVGIERAGENVINPGPDEELQAGDRILLLGNAAQLDTARAFLQEKASDSSN